MTGAQLLAHLAGDYLLQSTWMANCKTSSHVPAAVHAATYSLPFLALTRDPRRLAVIAGTHFVIDRWRLARHVSWAKNQLAPKAWRHPWNQHTRKTGYHDTPGFGPYLSYADEPCRSLETPQHLADWLLIIADNTMHVAINALALR